MVYFASTAFNKLAERTWDIAEESFSFIILLDVFIFMFFMISINFEKEFLRDWNKETKLKGNKNFKFQEIIRPNNNWFVQRANMNFQRFSMGKFTQSNKAVLSNFG